MSDDWGNAFLNSFAGNWGDPLEGSQVLVAVGSLDVSGGTNLILHYSRALQRLGAEVTIAHLLGETSDANWHPLGQQVRCVSFRDLKPQTWDLAIATWWPTVYELASLQSSSYIYFVQSIESRFARNSGDQEAQALASLTYTCEMPVITVASWMRGFLSALSNAPVHLVRNGVDKSLFRPTGTTVAPKIQDSPRVLVEGPLGVPMKAVAETLEVCRQAGAEDLWHVSPTKLGGSVGKADRNFARIAYKDMADIYRSCDILVKLSRVEGMFGPPLEAFHCGATALVSQVTGYSEYISNGENALVVAVDDFEAAQATLHRLLMDPPLLASLREGATHTASNWPSIEQTASEFASLCVGMLSGNRQNPPEFERLMHGKSQVGDLAKRGLDPRENLPPLFRRF